MAVLKCKMCGGDLNPEAGASVCECEYCGSRQTIPSVDNEKKLTLFARANRLRLACEFDKAYGVYESIVAEFPEEAEAYWGLVLCKYGIEYVDDPGTGKKIPTCHRSSFDSIMKDPNVELAQEYADVVARRLYRQEAKQMEQLREGIIQVSANEERYDVFICYKETDFSGKRTLDSVLAMDIYEALSDRGYRVFFSRVSLEDKLGTEYEPYIFAALNSAKIMLVIGTDYEYFNAVWVKNEWSRFLKLMAQDKSRHLIPCYKGIDAYDMPEEFARLQAQDLDKIGAVQDIVRGVQKLLPKQAVKETGVQQSAAGSNPTVESYLERAYLFLEDGEWSSADEYCEKVLDIDPRNPRAYLGKLMAQLRVKRQDDLKKCDASFNQNPNYAKVLRFCHEDTRRMLEEALACIAERLERERKEQQRQEQERQRQEAVRKERERRERSARLALVREKIRPVQPCIGAGTGHTVSLKLDGTVAVTGSRKDGQWNVSDWQNIVAIAAGMLHTVGLKADGTVVAVEGMDADNKGQCAVSLWRNIVAIAAGYEHTVGLMADGTLVAAGAIDYGKCSISRWNNIAAISAGIHHTVGLKTDGTVVAVGLNNNHQCDVSSWQDIVTIDAGGAHTVGLKADGTVVAVGRNDSNQCGVRDWQDIVAIAAGSFHTVGLKADGTVVAVGKNDKGQCDVSSWQDIVAIAAGTGHTVGVKADGTMVAVGNKTAGRCAVDGMKLFSSIDSFCEERTAARKKREEEIARAKALEAELLRRRNAGLCRHCGGEFKGIFKKVCASCGKSKDY